MTLVLSTSSLWTPDGMAPGWVAVDDGVITEVGTGPPPPGAEDLGDAVLAPAFVDLQCNGLDGVDFATTPVSAWLDARRRLARHGVTAVCPTFVSAPLETYDEKLAAAKQAIQRSAADAADVVGVHLEGPFLGGAPRAHDPAVIRPVDVVWLVDLLERWPGVVRIVTLAPEADPELEATRALVARGVVVALGHTTASFDDAVRAADAGATVVTHLFNGMRGLHHREPGVVGAALTDARLTPTVIADLVHVHPAVLRATFIACERVVTVSDTVATVGDVEPRDGAAWMPDGTLAGATTLLDRALVNLVRAGVPAARAIASVTSEPARTLGLEDRGSLQVGRRADFVALDPTTCALRRVWRRGYTISMHA